MIEIIIGIIVLILAIIGIAKLASGRGGGGGGRESLNPEEVVQTVSAWKKTLLRGLYGDPESLRDAMKYAPSVAGAAKNAVSAIYRQGQITREKVDAAVQKRLSPMQNAAEYLDDIPAIANTMSRAYELRRAGRIDDEQFKTYVLGEIRDQNSINLRHYKLRQASMA
jgi:hypothetical protein